MRYRNEGGKDERADRERVEGRMKEWKDVGRKEVRNTSSDFLQN